ncbi:hypothetical protein [Limnoglobus roseus]|uniref:Uncharacterized protein n=1 Tax=Limnoglobus roseus TaxID=2598579 RepID=A0A5C1AKU2_9BACT|nr:hypothetical protein [Limnoglobus roseus]QEL18332.1 hypothetical protein PX52LOC_05353 [Limnoglobus roseus]
MLSQIQIVAAICADLERQGRPYLTARQMNVIAAAATNIVEHIAQADAQREPNGNAAVPEARATTKSKKRPRWSVLIPPVGTGVPKLITAIGSSQNDWTRGELLVWTRDLDEARKVANAHGGVVVNTAWLRMQWREYLRTRFIPEHALAPATDIDKDAATELDRLI